MSTSNKPAFRAVSVKVREGRQPTYRDIGAAWPTRNGGYSVRLDALPIGDTILLMPVDDAGIPEGIGD
jgi:hypothetical protein